MDEWSAATFDGAEVAMRRDLAALEPDERVAWLARARRHAASTGALQAEVERRAEQQLRAWRSTPTAGTAGHRRASRTRSKAAGTSDGPS